MTRRTKIVATIGPATESPEMIRELILAGATTFRLNFSHGDHSEHAQRAATIRQVAHKLGMHVGILQDLQGPKIRLGRFNAGPITLAKGDPFALTARDVACDQHIATVTYDKLAAEVPPGSRILMDDGKVPADNPFVKGEKGFASIWSYGHRNPQGLAMHPATGQDECSNPQDRNGQSGIQEQGQYSLHGHQTTSGQ